MRFPNTKIFLVLNATDVFTHRRTTELDATRRRRRDGRATERTRTVTPRSWIRRWGGDDGDDDVEGEIFRWWFG